MNITMNTINIPAMGMLSYYDKVDTKGASKPDGMITEQDLVYAIQKGQSEALATILDEMSLMARSTGNIELSLKLLSASIFVKNIFSGDLHAIGQSVHASPFIPVQRHEADLSAVIHKKVVSLDKGRTATIRTITETKRYPARDELTRKEYDLSGIRKMINPDIKKSTFEKATSGTSNF